MYQACRRFSDGRALLRAALGRVRFFDVIRLAVWTDTADLKMLLIRVCQPGPDSRNFAKTSASIRSFTASFGFSMRGRPPLFLNCAITFGGRTSDAGLALAKSCFVHSGFSSCRSGSNFGFAAIACIPDYETRALAVSPHAHRHPEERALARVSKDGPRLAAILRGSLRSHLRMTVVRGAHEPAPQGRGPRLVFVPPATCVSRMTAKLRNAATNSAHEAALPMFSLGVPPLGGPTCHKI